LEVLPSRGQVVVGSEEDLLSTRVRLTGVNWLGGLVPVATRRVRARVRYRHQEQGAQLRLEEVIGGLEAELVFDEPVRAATPGQSAVFFDDEEPDRLLGGGIIRS
jgi:tRNA-specific 2-thiouridylase